MRVVPVHILYPGSHRRSTAAPACCNTWPRTHKSWWGWRPPSPRPASPHRRPACASCSVCKWTMRLVRILTISRCNRCLVKLRSPYFFSCAAWLDHTHFLPVFRDTHTTQCSLAVAQWVTEPIWLRPLSPWQLMEEQTRICFAQWHTRTLWNKQPSLFRAVQAALSDNPQTRSHLKRHSWWCSSPYCQQIVGDSTHEKISLHDLHMSTAGLINELDSKSKMVQNFCSGP